MWYDKVVGQANLLGEQIDFTEIKHMHDHRYGRYPLWKMMCMTGVKYELYRGGLSPISVKSEPGNMCRFLDMVVGTMVPDASGDGKF